MGFYERIGEHRYDVIVDAYALLRDNTIKIEEFHDVMKDVSDGKYDKGQNYVN